MAKYIDADLMALNESEAYMSAQTKIENPILSGLNSVVHRKIQQLIADTPAADVVSVVRCKDCKHHHYCEIHFCDALGMDCPDDSKFFCSYGGREDGDGNG